MEKIIVDKKKYIQLKKEVETLRNSNLYKKILKTNEELKKKIYTRKDLGF
jgi:hypothetical protein